MYTHRLDFDFIFEFEFKIYRPFFAHKIFREKKITHLNGFMSDENAPY